MDKIFIGNFKKGLDNYLEAFYIDNDSFPVLVNFLIFRGRAMRKRGTFLIGQLQKQVQIASSPASWEKSSFTLSAGSGNLFTQYSLSNVSLVPTSISIICSSTTQTYTDASGNGILAGDSGGTGTINYATGAITISSGASGTITGKFSYYPTLPVMGLRQYADPNSSFAYPFLIAFDTTYSYQYNTTSSTFYLTSYYVGSSNPVTWSGADYKQFWTTNYQNGLWATNNNPGMQFESIATISTSGSPTTITTSSAHGLVTGDYIWINEVTGTDKAKLNGISFSITKVDATSFTIVVSITSITNSGIFQTLTANAPGVAGDGIRFYTGDTTDGTGLPTSTSYGWVNFAPPLTSNTVAIEDLPVKTWYLVGAKAIVAFKDRLLFFRPSIQSSTTGPFELADAVIYSWNGTPYYTTPVPLNQSANVSAYYVDTTGYGGYIFEGSGQAINSVAYSEDVVLVGFSGKHSRFTYTSDIYSPFIFSTIDSDFGDSSLFSTINLGDGAISVGSDGIFLTDQRESKRIDLVIPDNIFNVDLKNNGAQRLSAVRNYEREKITICYPSEDSGCSFPLNTSYPTQTFLFNYRDNTWALFSESFTSQGRFYSRKELAWEDITINWEQWKSNWEDALEQEFLPSAIAGNAQGFVLKREEDNIAEAISGTITGLVNTDGGIQVTSPNHCLSASNPLLNNHGDYIQFGTIPGVTIANGPNCYVGEVVDANNFIVINGSKNISTILSFSGTYIGGGGFIRLSLPILKTKQFAPYWEEGRQVRLGVQKYLLQSTASSQVELQVYLSQDTTTDYNTSDNDSLVYSNVLFTSPETNNLQTPTASTQNQIWHRMSNSLQGESFQIGITLSESQMLNTTYQDEEIILHAMLFDVYRGPILA
ncbi:MAG: hypothetical protein KGI50_05290 [Patescibacteria group bacterium]|nr:hypothetical protein [Patescibacteria group bacterium]MDE2438726.1 hypothetical protein [Patescibacteria group bacterium]